MLEDEEFPEFNDNDSDKVQTNVRPPSMVLGANILNQGRKSIPEFSQMQQSNSDVKLSLGENEKKSKLKLV